MNLYKVPANSNYMNDGEVNVQPDDTVAALAFSPQRQMQTDFLASGTWGNNVSCYKVLNRLNGTYQGEFVASFPHLGPVLDVSWSDDCTKIFSASADKTVKMWDLQSNQRCQVGAHDAPVRTVHWVKTNSFSCIMTTSWDKTIKFWDTRTQHPMSTIPLPERCFCADVQGSMAVFSLGDKNVQVYKLEPTPHLIKKCESPFKFQHKCVSIFCNDKQEPVGYACGSVEGRVAIQYVDPTKDSKNFTFKCHRFNEPNTTLHEVYAVNDIAFHPSHGTMATVGSDGKYSFWDKEARTRLKLSNQMDQPITRCSINCSGEIFAYALGYDWSKGHEYAPSSNKNKICFSPCLDAMRAKDTNRKS